MVERRGEEERGGEREQYTIGKERRAQRNIGTIEGAEPEGEGKWLP